MVLASKSPPPIQPVQTMSGNRIGEVNPLRQKHKHIQFHFVAIVKLDGRPFKVCNVPEIHVLLLPSECIHHARETEFG